MTFYSIGPGTIMAYMSKGETFKFKDLMDMNSIATDKYSKCLYRRGSARCLVVVYLGPMCRAGMLVCHGLPRVARCDCIVYYVHRACEIYEISDMRLPMS